RISAARGKARERPFREAAVSSPGISASPVSGRKPRRRRRTPVCTRPRSTTFSSPPLPASTAPRLLETEAGGAVAKARDLPVDDLLEQIEKSGLRGRGGAGYPFVDKIRAVRHNADGGPIYLIANAYDADPGSPLSRTLIASAETLAWVPLIVAEQARASTKLVSVTGAVVRPGVYEITLGSQLGEILTEAGGATGKLKGLHVGGPTGGILAGARTDTRFDFDDLRVAGTHMGSAQVRAIPAGTCIVNEAAALFAYLAKESCA